MKLVRESGPRKAAAALRLDYYRDRQSQDLLQAIKARWSRPEDFRLFQINVVRKIVNRRAMVYRRPPVRTFEGMSPEVGQALYAALNADAVLKKANRLTELLKTTVLQVGWSEGAGAPWLAVIPPSNLDVVADDPERPDRVIVTHAAPPEIASTALAPELKQTYSDWTATTFHRRDYRGRLLPVPGNPGGVNPYGVLPFVPLFDEVPDDAFFLPGGDDLVEAQRAINVALANLWRAIELQSHGQPVATGLSPSDALSLGPDKTVLLPEKGTFNFATPNTPVEGVLKALEFVIKQTAVANDLGANVFELSPKAESAAAKIAETKDLLEARADDIELWRRYEVRLFEVLKRVVNTHAPGTIPEGASLRVDFAEIEEDTSETERLDGYQRRIDLGLWSPVDAFMADNPDIRDRAAALAELQTRRDEMAALGLPFAGPSFLEQTP